MDKNIYKQWETLYKQEAKFLKGCADKKPSRLVNFLADKVPAGLQNTLTATFAKSFSAIFEKGVVVIEKSYNKQEIELKYKVNAYAYSLKQDKKRAKAFEREATKSSQKNVLISGVKGVGLGLLGIGLPDIPIFIGVVLKGIYEIALQYGFEYEGDREQYFILNIIKASLCHGDDAFQGDVALNGFINTGTIPDDYDPQKQIAIVADVLSHELLYMKFVQGLPIVGAVGGVYDAIFVGRILSYARLKYERRFLTRQTDS